MKFFFVTSIIIYLFFIACDNREWDNPYDASCNPEIWSPKSIIVSQELADEVWVDILCNYPKNNKTYDGIQIDRKIRDSSWQNEYMYIDGQKIINETQFGNLWIYNEGDTEYTIYWSDTIIQPGTEYIYRIYAVAGNNISEYRYDSITTQIDYPEIVLNSVEYTTPTSVTCTCKIESNGGSEITEKGICWNTSGNPTINNNTINSNSELDTYVVKITNIDPASNYYICAYAYNSKGRSYSNEITKAPILTTTETTDITITTAKSGGQIDDNVSFKVTSRGVCWSTSQNPTIDDAHTNDGTGTGSFISNLTGLNEWSTYYVRAYVSDDNETAYGNELSFKTIGASLIDYDNNEYDFVRIGNQIWMAENLKTTHYADGTAIDLVENSSSWDDYVLLNSPAMCYYNNNASNEADTYGALYTWVAARMACPDDWHLPSDAEWTELIDYLGGISVAGGKMKEPGFTHWESPNTGATNESGFNAFPGGRRNDDGIFNFFSTNAYFWGDTEFYGHQIVYIILYNDDSEVSYSTIYYTDYGFSVRCLKD